LKNNNKNKENENDLGFKFIFSLFAGGGQNKALDLARMSLYFAASLELDKGARHESSQLFEVTKRPSPRLSDRSP